MDVGRRLKVKVTVNISQDVYEKAHALGINVSKASENYLKQLIEAIEATQNNKQVFGEAFSDEKGSVVRSPRFEAWQAPVDWLAFKEFCKKNNGESHARQLVSYAERYQACLLKHDFIVLRSLSDTMRPNAMKGLSALSKFLGCYEDFKLLVRNSNLKWSGKSADDVFIERLNNQSNVDSEAIWNWVKRAKEERPELSGFLDLMAVSGLRFIESFNSYNLQIRLAKEDKLNTYYFTEKETLEHYRFKEIFIRKSKKAFVSFVPSNLVNEVVKQDPFVSTDAIQKLLSKRGLQLRFADIREAHATFMTKYLKKEEIDFLHGRVTSGVFMQHYFNPSLIADLKTRAFQGIKEIQEKIVL